MQTTKTQRKIMKTKSKFIGGYTYGFFVWDGKWIEILGAGMVHPKVLTGVGYDPNEFSGFAFGIGPERVAMLKNKIKDIRHFHVNDLRFLSQFVK